MRDFRARGQECKVTGSQTSLCRAAKSPTLGQDDKVDDGDRTCTPSRVESAFDPVRFSSCFSFVRGNVLPFVLLFFCFQKLERRITNYCHICNAELNPDSIFELQCRNGKKNDDSGPCFRTAVIWGRSIALNPQSPPASVSEAQTRPPSRSLW